MEMSVDLGRTFPVLLERGHKILPEANREFRSASLACPDSGVDMPVKLRPMHLAHCREGIFVDPGKEEVF